MESLIANKAGAGADIIDSSTATFAKDVIDASRERPVIVDFWAPWCGPCKQLGPVLEKVVTAAKGAVKLVKVDIDQNQALAQQLRIQSIPAVYAFFQGRPVDGFMGALPESQVKQFVERLVQAAGGDATGGLAEVLDHAKQALAAGDAALAQQIYEEVLQAEPGNPDSIAGLARIKLEAKDIDSARQMLATAPKEAEKHAEIAAVRTAIDLAEQAEAAGPVAELKAKVEADPKDHQSRLDLAMALYAGGQREEAVDQLLELVRRDRKWNEEAGRKQLVKFFEAMGPTDPLTVEARKRLSSILFS